MALLSEGQLVPLTAGFAVIGSFLGSRTGTSWNPTTKPE